MIVSEVLNYFSSGSFYKEKPYSLSEELIKDLSECPQSLALLEEARKVVQELGIAALEIRLEPTNFRFRAKTQGNVITINPDLIASKQRYLALFELTNVIQFKEHAMAVKAVAEGAYKSSEDYVRAIEFIEYKGLIRAKAVAQAINKEKGSFFRPYIKDSSEPLIMIKKMGFNLYYNLQVSTAHKEHHRNNWKLINKKFNIVVDDNYGNRKNDWVKRTLKISLIGCVTIAMTCSLLINLKRLQKELLK